jgi:hypothetical protein
MRNLIFRLGLVFVCCLYGAPAFAQSFVPPDPKVRPWATAKMNLGPVYFAPTFELRDVGIDDNVFNEKEFQKKDLTGTLAMRSTVGIHFGEAVILQFGQANSYIWYRRYRTERSIENGLNATLEFRTEKFRPWVRWFKSKSSQRSGTEIDERAERQSPNIDFGMDVDLAFRMGLSVAGKHSKLKYKDTEEFDGINLGTVLNNTTDSAQGFFRYQVSDLTDVVVGADFERARFGGTPLRDADSYNYYAGIRLKQGASIVGNLTAGYKRQAHKDPTVPDFSGVTANFNAALVPSEFFRFEFTASRDLGYSYLERYPYFIEEAGSGEMTSRFSEYFDVILKARGTWLRYNDTVDGSKDPRTDRTVVLGIGGGFFVGGGNGTRLGLLFEHHRRDSPVDLRNYKTNKISSNYRFSF